MQLKHLTAEVHGSYWAFLLTRSQSQRWGWRPGQDSCWRQRVWSGLISCREAPRPMSCLPVHKPGPENPPSSAPRPVQALPPRRPRQVPGSGCAKGTSSAPSPRGSVLMPSGTPLPGGNFSRYPAAQLHQGSRRPGSSEHRWGGGVLCSGWTAPCCQDGSHRRHQGRPTPRAPI